MRSSTTATGALGVAAGTLALALAGAAGWILGLGRPLVFQGMLVVAIGGTILGITLSAVGLLTTRGGGDPVGRQRAWLGAWLCGVLLVALVVAFQVDLRGPVVVEEAGPSAAGAAPGETLSRLAEQSDGQSGLVPIAVEQSPAQAFVRAERAARDLGWSTTHRDPEDRRLELRAEGRPDLVIRVRPAASGALIELRPSAGGTLDAEAGYVRAFVDRIHRS